jgi:hypothetical protein
MKKILAGLVFGGVVLTGWTGWAQTHKVAKPESVVRAVGIYEWTGDLAKPKASRLIPVSLYIEGHIEDAGIYIARPVPFALVTGNVYELQDAGIAKGTLELVYARHMQSIDRASGDAAYDDGWFGYGTFHAPAAAKRTSTPLRALKTTSVITSSASDSSKPHLTNKSGDATTTSGGSDDKTASKTDAGGSSASAADPDRPTMKRRSSDPDSSSASTQSAGNTPADDPDRPTMKRRTTDAGSDSNGASTTQTSGSAPADDPDRPTMKKRSPDASDTTADSGSTKSGGSDPADDPDRPTLKRRSPEEAKKQRAQQDDKASVTAVGSLNEDPNRPNLHRGKPASAMTEADLPKLNGLPQDLHQMVAVSDAKNRDPHEFTRPWEDAAEKAAVLGKMQTMARTQLASYGVAKTAPVAAAPSTAAKKTVPASRTHRTATAPAPVNLLDEELKGYTLSYGGAVTYVYSAHTAGTGADLRYVTVVAQADALGELKPAMQSVTDAAHLDRAPWMRFVDVVDVEASNRASMLFELRGQSSRQFALYRVIADRPEQIFLTGTTQ